VVSKVIMMLMEKQTVKMKQMEIAKAKLTDLTKPIVKD